MRLFCFHHAGGGPALYRGWDRLLGPHIDVDTVVLPGHEHRSAEPRFTDVESLVRQLDHELDDSSPYAFFGHSMGALVAYRLACRRRGRGANMPRALCVSACSAPHLPPPLPPVDDLDDASLALLLGQIGGLPTEVLSWQSMLADVLAVARDDLLLCDSRLPGAELPLDIPIHAFGGDADPVVSDLDLAEWRECTTASFDQMVLPGGHFYLESAASDLLPRLRSLLQA